MDEPIGEVYIEQHDDTVRVVRADRFAAFSLGLLAQLDRRTAWLTDEGHLCLAGQVTYRPVRFGGGSLLAVPGSAFAGAPAQVLVCERVDGDGNG